MPALLGVLVGIVAVVLMALRTKGGEVSASQVIQGPQATQAETSAAIYDSIFASVGASRGVDPDLLKAFAMRESNMDANAVRWNLPNDVSVGLMQVLCVPPAGASQDQDFIPVNKLNVEGWPVSFQSLFDPQTNVDIAAQIVHWNLSTYGFPRGIAVYNDYSARHAAAQGPFPNQSYVNDVLANLRKLKGE